MARFSKALPALKAIFITLAALIGFLVGLGTLGIVVTPIIAIFVVLITMKKGGERRAIAKSRKIIVVATVFMLLLAGLFPPYKEAEVDEKGELTGWHIKWAFNKDFQDMIDPQYYVNPDGWKSLVISEYATARQIQLIEIFGILVLAGAALVITRKR
ncbi:MAG: hypothetical protein A2W03_02395 [Candidatus Aminicenantes bacterium RBG_16_63_16]|nr:MAG: hypothetical protein A2W03_02395 [Candidatus Aminicenantes bacterium RBG_16_63_16]HCS49940.1 hypothetical protein [Candidatus Aminicenantes bacterium]